MNEEPIHFIRAPNISWQKQGIQGNKSCSIYMVSFGEKVNVRTDQEPIHHVFIIKKYANR